MSNFVALRAVVHGRVQGVYFRAYVLEKAAGLGLTGVVRNLPSGREVEVQAEGEKEQLEQLLGFLKTGPPASLVEEVTATWSKASQKFTSFSVR